MHRPAITAITECVYPWRPSPVCDRVRAVGFAARHSAWLQHRYFIKRPTEKRIKHRCTLPWWYAPIMAPAPTHWTRFLQCSTCLYSKQQRSDEVIQSCVELRITFYPFFFCFSLCLPTHFSRGESRSFRSLLQEEKYRVSEIVEDDSVIIKRWKEPGGILPVWRDRQIESVNRTNSRNHRNALRQWPVAEKSRRRKSVVRQVLFDFLFLVIRV